MSDEIFSAALCVGRCRGSSSPTTHWLQPPVQMNTLVREYLVYVGYSSTLEVLDAEAEASTENGGSISGCGGCGGGSVRGESVWMTCGGCESQGGRVRGENGFDAVRWRERQGEGMGQCGGATLLITTIHNLRCLSRCSCERLTAMVSRKSLSNFGPCSLTHTHTRTHSISTACQAECRLPGAKSRPRRRSPTPPRTSGGRRT